MGATFAELLRQARTRSSLSQQELAERAGLTVNAISQLERGVRTRPYPHTVRALADALGLEGDERARVLASVPSRAPADRSPGPRAPLPHPGVPLIGRDDDLRTVREALDEHRLVTLTGPGGVGKTTLAFAAARAAAGDHPDGVTVVELADVTDVDVALVRIGRQVGLADAGSTDVRSQLHAALRGTRRLLVLDNLEQLPGLVDDIARLLIEVPDLHLLATSRAALRLRLEHEVPVRPLATPPSAPDIDRAFSSDAVRLLLARAPLVAERLAADASALATICRRVDGLPLGLELAAAWLRVLTPQELAERLADPLTLLVDGPRDLPPRHRALRDTVAWSEALLEPGDQVVFRRLGVLPAAFDLETAAAVADLSEVDVVHSVALLIERSLLARVPEVRTGRARFRMLSTVRAYSVEQLERHGEVMATRARLADVIKELTREARTGLDGPAQAAWLDHLEERLPEVRATLTHLLDSGQEDAAARCYGALLWLWYLRHATEGDTVGADILNRDALAPLPRADAACAWALVALGRGRESEALRVAEAAAETALAAGDRETALRALSVLAHAAAATGDAERTAHAAARVDELVGEPARDGEPEPASFAGAAHASATLAHVRVALAAGAHDLAGDLLQTADDRVTAAGMPWLRALWLNIAAGHELICGRHEQTAERLVQSIALSRELGDAPAMLYALASLGVDAVLRGRPREAALVLGAADRHATRTGQRLNDPATLALVEAQRAAAEQALGSPAYARALAAGAGRSLEQVLEDIGLAGGDRSRAQDGDGG